MITPARVASSKWVLKRHGNKSLLGAGLELCAASALPPFQPDQRQEGIFVVKLSEFISDVGRPIAYYPKLARIIGGVKSTVFLCQLFYWRGKGSDPEGWIYKTRDEWEDETGLSHEEQNGARRKLKALKLLEEKHDRLHHRLYYRIAADILDQLWQESRLPKPQNTVSGNGKTRFRETIESGFVNRNTENTSEITTKIKSGAKTTRPHDDLFDAITEVCNVDITIRANAQSVGTVRAALASAVPPYTAAEVRDWGAWQAWRHTPPTVWQLRGEIGSVRNQNGSRINKEWSGAGYISVMKESEQ